jgi:uncharacterized protein GlcG (DUF336 family)
MFQVKRLSLEDARILLQGAQQKIQEIGVSVCIAIVDESGNLIAFERSDSARISSITTAIDKAFTAAAARNPTRFYQENTQPGKATWGIQGTNGGRFCIAPGGIPVEVANSIVGGIGCSGGSPDQDEQIAMAAIEYFLQTPPSETVFA